MGGHGLNFLIRMTSCWALLNTVLNVRIRGISRLVEVVSVSQGLCPIELVSQSVSELVS